MWQCPECKRKFEKNNQSHSCRSYPLENHFKSEKCKALYDALCAKIEKEIGKFYVESPECCIHLVAKKTFVGVFCTKDHIKISFTITEKLDTPRIERFVQMSANRFNHRVIVQDEKEIDKELISWLKEAYGLMS